MTTSAAAPRLTSASFRARHRAGFTLLEVMVVLVIMAGLASIAVMAASSMDNHRVSAEALRLSGMLRMVYGRSAINGIRYAVVLDLDNHSWRVECSDENVLLDDTDQDAVTRSRERRYGSNDAEADPFGLGTSQPTLAECSEMLLESRPLRAGVKFRQVLTTHDEEPITSGTTTIGYFPNGYVERSLIWLQSEDGASVMTLSIDPMTGRVRAYGEDLEIPEDFFTVQEDR